MTEKGDHLQNARRRAPLHVSLRFLVALILQSWLAYYFTHEGALGTGLQSSDALKKVLLVFIPTITILFLLPVIIRGSFSQRLIAIILSICPAWIGFYGWAVVIGGLLK
jgi:hypothetical protein